MTAYNSLLTQITPHTNVKFVSDEKIGANIIYIPESIPDATGKGGLSNFLNTQIKTYYSQITIPDAIPNFLGKRLSNPKYKLALKKEYPAFVYNKVPGKQLHPDKANIFDLSGIINDIVSLSYSKSPKLVFDSLMSLINSVLLDYPTGRDNILLIQGDLNSPSDFLNLLNSQFLIHGSNLPSNLSGIIYDLKGTYIPLTHLKKEKNTTGNILVYNKQNYELILTSKAKAQSGEKVSSTEILKEPEKAILKEEEQKQTIKEAKEKITELSKNKESITSSMKQIKQIVHGIDTIKGQKLVGSFSQKLETLFKEDEGTRSSIEKLSNEINRKYNGNVSVKMDTPYTQKNVFDPIKIVGLEELGGYNKQFQELTTNMDELIEDLVTSTLTKDPEVPIKVVKISHKIVDNFKDRYKEYTVRIKHEDTKDAAYNISFRVPIPVQGKYIKIGGNNYILINQLFPKPIQKVAPNLVRFYTHYSTSSLTLKNTKLTAGNSFIQIEDAFVTKLKSINAIELKNFDNSTKDDIVETYGLPDLKDFKYSYMKVKL